MSNLHDEKRLQIITLYKHTAKKVGEIAADLGVHKSTVSRTIKRYKESGDYKTNYSNCGRRHIFDERDHRRIRNLSLVSPRASASEIRSQMGAEGDVSERTMRRTMASIGIKAVKPGRRPFMNNQQKANRLKWAQEHHHWTVEDWKRVLWSDETIIQIQDNSPKYVRIVEGHELTPQHYVSTRKHPLSIMIWACFSWRGTGRAHVVEGNLNSEGYIEQIINHRVIQEMGECFPTGYGLFQQDNAPCHKSKKVMEYFATNGINLIPWPPVSPDLNPIENLWSIVKRRLKTFNLTRKQELIREFLRIRARDEELTMICQKLISSMPERIEPVIKAKGGPTKY